MNVRTFLFALITSFILFGCSPTADNEPLTDYPNSHLLLDAAELNQMLQNDDILLIDVRGELPDTLIPGAVHFAAVSELIDSDHPVEFYLIGPEVFQEKMRSIGLNPDDRVVIYDDGNSLASARLFYALDYYGFSNTAILNGGIQSWLAEGFEISTGAAQPEPGTFSFNVNEAKSCDINYIMEASNDPDKIIFDARSAGEYTGEDARAEKSGHIPNAVNLEWSRVLQQEGIPYFLPAQEIQDKFTALGITPDKEVISHCHTNVRGSHAYFTLRLMGYDSVRTYEGSWAEYGNAPNAIVQ
jgi:thiosulfate/3-mercaptopyruvate sulfurtransferase